ncbi:hypothetical protein ACOSQ4_021177 [Xanthoceras sorbifolium]
MGSSGVIVELQRNSNSWTKLVDEIEELKKKNAGLLYMEMDGQVVGYVMYSWPSSLSASITKLAEKKCRARKVQQIVLHVYPMRSAAMNLHNKFCFQVDDLIQGYYSSDRPAYRMFLDFDSN